MPVIKFVKGTGPSSAKIIAIGDSASKEEAARGIAFEGYTGNYLKRWCQNAGYAYDSIYRTLYIKNYIVQSRSKKKAQESFEDAIEKFKPLTYEQMLIDEINAINPNVIITFGDRSLEFITGESSAHKFRGSILPVSPNLRNRLSNSHNIKVIASIHPRDVAAKWSNFFITQIDIIKAIKYSTDPREYKENYLVWVCRDYQELEKFISRYPKSDLCVFDIEMHLSIPSAIGIALSPNEAISIPLLDKSINNKELAVMFKRVNRLFNSGIPIVNQNLKFDTSKLERFGFSFKNEAGDTALIAKILYPEFGKKLDFLTSIYADMAYYKDEGSDYDPKTRVKDQLYLYNAKDCIAAYRVYKAQIEELKEDKLYSFYTNKVWPLYQIYKKMEKRGLLVDNNAHEVLVNKYESEFEYQMIKLRDMTGEDLFGPKALSSLKVGKFLYQQLKLPEHTHVTPMGNKAWSTDANTLEYMELNEVTGDSEADSSARDVLRTIIAIRHLSKILEFLECFIHPDGRMRTSFDLGGTETGRTSTGKTTDYYYGFDREGKMIMSPMGGLPNFGIPFHTIPRKGFLVDNEYMGKDIKSMFVPTPGYVFVEGDLSQAEARRVAILAEDMEMLEMFDTKPGIHIVTAQWLFPNQEISKGTFEYDMGKKTRHAGNYDMGVYQMSQQSHISMNFAGECLQKFHAASPKIRNVYHKKVERQVKANREIITPFGRRRIFYDKVDDRSIKAAYAHDPQSTITDHLKFNILQPLSDHFGSNPGIFFVMEKHDSIVAEVRVDLVDEYCEKFDQLGETRIDCRKGSFPYDIDLRIPVELETSDTNLMEMKEWCK